ncbi:unnamed protein product, partial [marine sediment metagenome]
GVPPVEEFQRIVPLDSGGTISLENINGNIEIYGWDREEVDVFAEKMIPRPREAKVRVFRRGFSTPKIEFDKFEDFVKIRTRATGNKEASVVDFYVSVPHSINLRDISTGEGNISISDVYGEVYVELRNGDLKVDNFSGSLTASVVNGSIRTSLFDLRKEDEIIITTKQGDIVVFLQEEVNAKIECSTPNGEIFSEFEFDTPLPASKASVEIGEDGAYLSLTSLNGDIRIKKINLDYSRVEVAADARRGL